MKLIAPHQWGRRWHTDAQPAFYLHFWLLAGVVNSSEPPWVVQASSRLRNFRARAGRRTSQREQARGRQVNAYLDTASTTSVQFDLVRSADRQSSCLTEATQGRVQLADWGQKRKFGVLCILNSVAPLKPAEN